MEEKIFIGYVVSALIAIGIMYAKMILIHRDVQLQIHERRVNDWKEVNKLYLQIVSNCDEQPTKNVTYKQMHERIKHYFKHEYSCS